MTRTARFQSRVALTLALMLAIAGLVGAVRVSALPAAAQVVDAVVVSCDAPGADGATTCVFSAPGAEQLAVPAGGFCSAIVSASGTFDGASYVSASGDPSVVATFGSAVAVGGGATYTVTIDGVASAIGASGVVCIDVPAAPAADQTDDTVPDETVSDPASNDETLSNPAEGGEPAADDAGDGAGTGTPVDTGDTSDSESTDTPDATDTTDTESGSAGDGVTDDTTGDGAGDQVVSPANIIIDPDTPNDPPAPVAVTVTIVSYLCETDPGLSDPVTAGCVAASDIDYAARDSSGDLGTATTDASGTTSFASTVGAAFLVEQAEHISGYRTVGDGRFEVLSLDGDTTITFVNVKMQALGRLQIAAGLCPTSDVSRTEFSIADQNNFGAASLMSCEPNGEALFTVSSDALPGGSWVVRMEADGSWRGQLPAGMYTVTAPDGTVSPSIMVKAGAISVAVAVSYVHQTPGTVMLEHFLCTEGTDGEYIEVDPAGAPDASCSPWSATVVVSEFSGARSDTITIAQNGSTPVNLKAGHYVVTGPQGTTQDFTITAEVTTVVRVLTVATTGVLMVDAHRCPAGVTPTDAETQCTATWGGASFTLTASGGGSEPITVSGEGSAVITGVVPGSYTLTGDNVCAVLSGGVDASGGFTILAGQTTRVAIFGCFAPDDGTGNPNNPGNGGGDNPPGDGTGGTDHPIGQPTGGDGTGVDGANRSYGSNSALNVTQLPNTGAGDGVSRYWWPMLLLALAGALTLVGYRTRPQVVRRKR